MSGRKYIKRRRPVKKTSHIGHKSRHRLEVIKDYERVSRKKSDAEQEQS